MKTNIYVTARIRQSPFFHETIKAGATSMSVYNKTYLPGGYISLEDELWGLINGVALWDVTCQKVVEIAGPDARRFLDYLTPRNIDKLRPGQCRYILITDQYGGILNDPVMMCMAEDRFWLSLADNDILLWAKGVAVGANMDVTLRAPENATLQVQGPKSLAVLETLVGPDIQDLKYYHHRPAVIAGIPVIVARTGWSSERGYEIYLQDMVSGPALWQAVRAAGEPHGMIVSAPSRVRRIEAGTPDFGADMDETVNPFEVGLGRLVDLGPEAHYIGKDALRRAAAEGLKRSLVGIRVAGEKVAANDRAYPVTRDGTMVGRMTSWAYSPRLDASIGLAMLEIGHTALGTQLVVEAPDGPAGGARAAEVVERPFFDVEHKLARA